MIMLQPCIREKVILKHDVLVVIWNGTGWFYFHVVIFKLQFGPVFCCYISVFVLL